MAYKKPQIVAKSAPQRSFAAGCPTGTRHGTTDGCRSCERTK